MKKIFLCLLSMIAAWTAQAQFSYYFFDENNVWRTIPSDETPAIKITDATTTLNQNDAWYLIEDDISLSECTVTGKNVHLFIPEYKCLTTSNFVVASGASLLVYCNGTYSQGSIKGPSATPLTAIIEGTLTLVNGRLGRYDGSTSLKITETGIVNVNNEGKIYTESIGDGAGIEIEGELNVNGSVYASGRDDQGTGIDVATKGKLTLFPGSYVEAKGSTNGASIDAKGTVNITGGRVYATENNGIGIGSASTVGTISITGGQVYTSLIGHNSSGNGGTIILGWTDRSNEINATGFEADQISIANDQVFIVDNVWLEGELSTEQITKLSNADILNPPTVPVPDNIPQFENLKEVYNIDYDGKFHSVLELLGNPVVENPYGKIVYIVGGKETEDPKVQSPGEYTISYRFKSTDPRFLDEEDGTSHYLTQVSVNAIELCDKSYRYAIIDKEKKNVCVLGFNFSAEDFTYADGISKIDIPYTVTLSLPTVDGKTETSTYYITQIASEAFQRESDAEVVREVTLNEGLQAIGERAFLRCGIENITFPSTLREIGDSAFHRQQKIGNGKINVVCNGIIAPIFVSGSCTVHNHPFAFAQCGTLTIPDNSFGYETWCGFDGIIEGTETSMLMYDYLQKYTFDGFSPKTLSFSKKFDGEAFSTQIDEYGKICNYPSKISEKYKITKIEFGKWENDQWMPQSDAGEYKSAKVWVEGDKLTEPLIYDFRENITATIKPIEIAEIIKEKIATQKEYDGGVWVTLLDGTPISTDSKEGFANSITLPNGDVFIFTMAQYNSPNVKDANSISINGSIANSANYILPEKGITITQGVKITPKRLSVVANFPDNFSIVKDYDGTIQIPEGINLLDLFSLSKQEIANGDNVSIETISAEYENETPGASKNIVFKFTISSTNYDVKDTTFAIGEINEIKTNNIVISKAGVSQVDTKERYCADTYGNNIQLKFEVVEGKPAFYKIYDIPGISSDLKQVTEDDQQAGSYIINIGVMSDVKPGQYDGKIDFFADENGTRQNEKPYEFTLTVYLPKNIVKQLYHNVIFVDNHDNLFTAYQWYKNDQPLKGETKQYVTERPELTGIYSVEVTTQSGIKLHSCPTKSFATTKLSPTVTPYPNPAKAGIPFTLKLMGGIPENASIMIFNNAGAKVMTIDNVTENTTITLPSGYYSGALIYNGEKSGFKIIVE